MNCKKKVINRFLLGIPIGVFYGMTCALMIGLFNPAFQQSSFFYGEYSLFVKHYFASIIVGSCFSTCSVIWEVERWSLLRQIITYIIPTFLVLLVAGVWAEWYGTSLLTIGMFAVIYFLIFTIMFFIIGAINKRKASEINKLIKD